jgi:release factor glutamine methyltransferase
VSEAVTVAPRSVRASLADASDRLARAGCDTPRLDAEVLLAHALGVGRERLLIEAESSVGNAAMVRFQQLVGRREAREPVAYIVGHREFRRISLIVDPRVLIPRPETELLVEVGLGLPAGSRVVDVGTGSGAVALALADERPDLEVWGTDVSADALSVADENVRRLGLTVRLIRADLLDRVGVRFDAVLANLPYVADSAELAPEIASYEPRPALFAGLDGLDLLRRLIGMLDGVPTVALEVGVDQAEAVQRMLTRAGYRSTRRLRDLAGHERVVVGRLRA